MQDTKIIYVQSCEVRMRVYTFQTFDLLFYYVSGPQFHLWPRELYLCNANRIKHSKKSERICSGISLNRYHIQN
jgi:hypothetical protein